MLRQVRDRVVSGVWRAGTGVVWNAWIRGMACGNRSGVECWDKGNGVAGNMMSINNISILVVGVLGTTRMLMLVIFKRLGATGWNLCARGLSRVFGPLRS